MNTHILNGPAIDTLLTIQQSAELLSVSERTVRRVIQRGELPTVRMLGRIVRVKPSDLAAFVLSKVEQAADEPQEAA